MSLLCASGQVTWTLPAELNIYQVGELKTELQAALAYGLPLDCTLEAVEDLDTSGIQLLLVAQRECALAGRSFRITANSPVSEEALRLLGLNTESLVGTHPAESVLEELGAAQ